MTKFQEKIFKLWKKVQRGNKIAKKEFKKLYLEKYLNNKHLIEGTGGADSKACIHIMYSHLFNLKKRK